MFEYKVDSITIYNTSAFDITNENSTNIEKKIAMWIVDNREEDILRDIFEKNYEGFNEYEKEHIIGKVLNILDKSKYSRKLYIEERISEYLTKERFINIPGFIRFRLKEYKNELENILDCTIDKYLCEREYYEFIALIKEYIEYQNSYISVLNILTTGEKTRYFTENWIEISDTLNREYSFETDLTEDDKLLTILVLCAPEKIIWHNTDASQNHELKITLKEIFGNRISLCNKCSMCSKFIEKYT